MPFAFPPIPVYPNGYDSDYTLFLVFNTAEAQTTEDTDANADEVSVRPQPAGSPEIWADNGYANISGELFYYDRVRKNGNGKVCRLRRCTRSLAGRPSQFNPTGTWVRGFVIAEHHNQIVRGVLLAEKFIGENFSTDYTTLDWRIRHLADTPFLVDDFCADAEFEYETVSTSPLTGTVINYSVNVQGSASFNLTFGDGSSTSSQQSGSHTYSPGAMINPVLVLQNSDCQLVMTPTNVTPSNMPSTIMPTIVTVPMPSTISTTPFSINIPIPPDIPPLTIPSQIVPAPTMNIPPIVLPSITGMPTPPINFPSQINVSPIPSVITISPPINVPSRIIGPNITVPSSITFSNIPSNIMFGPAPPMLPLQIIPPMIPPIQVEPVHIPSVIKIEAPSLRGIEEALSRLAFPSVIDVRIIESNCCLSNITVNCCDGDNTGSGPGPGGPGMSNLSLIGSKNLKLQALPKLEFDADSIKSAFTHVRQEFQNFKVNVPNPKVDWGDAPTIKVKLQLDSPKKDRNLRLGEDTVEAEDVPFNGEFKLLPPDIPDIQVKHDVPSVINVQHNLKDIKLTGAENVPTEINLLPPKEGIQVSIVPFTLPELRFDKSSLEGASIPLKIPELPTLKVEFPEKMPGLSVVFPKQMPKIEVEVPKNAKVPLVYEGPPIPIEPVKINFVVHPAGSEIDESLPCVVISPCPRR